VQHRVRFVGPDSLAGVHASARGLDAISVYGPFVLALYLLAASRWGSYLFPGPPYLADLTLGLLIVERMFAAATNRVRSGGTDGALGLSIFGLLTWTVLVLLAGEQTTIALRDAAPYLYAILVVIAAPVSGVHATRAQGLLTAALVVHAAWVTAALLFPGLPEGTPSLGHSQTRIFEIRADFDGVICGLLAGIGLHRAVHGRAIPVNLLLTGWGLALVFGLATRAGLIAVAMQFGMLALVGLARPRVKKRTPDELSHPHTPHPHRSPMMDPRLVVAIIVLAIPAGAFLARNAASVERLATTVGEVSSTGSFETKRDTTRARSRSWGHLVDWLGRDAERTLLGVGFGPDFVTESGAGALLVGVGSPDEPRAPHNFLLNTWARLGMIGCLLVLAVMFAGARLAFAVARHAPELPDVDLLAILLVVSVPVAGFFGVILESPFGAIPYFWALAHLGGRACEVGAARSLRELVARGPSG
jgi:hypothetical protein